MPNWIDILKAGGGFVTVVLFIWKLLLPTIDWFLKSRCDKIYEKAFAELKVFKKEVDNNSGIVQSHSASILLQGQDIKRLSDAVSTIPRTNEILEEVKGFVKALTEDMGDMKVMVGRIDERTRKVEDASN